MSLMQLTYASCPFSFDDAMLAGILLDARRCNAQDEITGVLVVRRDVYLQLLEGPEAAVEDAYVRIRQDCRHTNVHGVRRRSVSSRMFPEWTMRDDPARPWLWSPEAIASGIVETASDDDVMSVFERVRLSPPV